jgi:hypothetical protein
MNREDIFRMAQETELINKDYDFAFLNKFTDKVERFAALVAFAEREACAKLCESIDMEAFGVLPVRTVMITNHCAEAIRARSKE